MKEITYFQINKIMYFKGEIWDEEDQDYPDYRKVKLWERASDRYLKPYSKGQQAEIYDTICFHKGTLQNAKYLENKGYKIITDSKEQADFILKYKLRKKIPFNIKKEILSSYE